MKKPVIGIVESKENLASIYMREKYISALSRAGAIVKFLPATDNLIVVRNYVNLCDGILVQGGSDVNPLLYGEEKNDKCEKTNDARDKFEPLLISEAVAQNKALLCICRGMQMLNVVFGGTLFQDIDNKKRDINHRNLIRKQKCAHTVQVEKDSLLYSVVNAQFLSVNSLHHQAVNKIGDGLKVVAVSADGIIEALEIENYNKALAVQWHPERMTKDFNQQQKIFDNFVNVMANCSIE